MRLPPTSDALLRDDTRPYFLWWLDMTVGDLRRELANTDDHARAYYEAAVLREANSRDAWLYLTPEAVRRNWRHIARYLGKARAKWAYLLKIEHAVVR
jgi:hypothetical protein